MYKILAQNLTIGSDETTYEISGPSGITITNVADLVNNGVNLILAIAGLGLLFMIITAGFTLLTSAGDAKKTEAGKNRLTYALVGFGIIFIAFWIVQLLSTALGVTDVGGLFQ